MCEGSYLCIKSNLYHIWLSIAFNLLLARSDEIVGSEGRVMHCINGGTPSL
jgi:hypothetical protein